MTIDKIKELIRSSEEYKFLKEDKHLGNSIILLTTGGSHAYGTNIETSDVDIRGIALNSKSEILLGEDFEQVVNVETDTTVYSFNKMLNLLSENNPNTIEILGSRPDHYFCCTDVARQLINNRKIFLSKICVHTFCGYATSQLRRLENKTIRNAEQKRREEHIIKSIDNASYEFKNKYFKYAEDAIKLYVEKSDREDFEHEIFMDIALKHYPLRDWANMWNEMKCIVSSYEKMGKRNTKAIEHDKLGKHMEHLIRLLMMCIDILEKEEVITYREKEHDLLMSIRMGEYLDSKDVPKKEFYELLNDYEKKLDYAKQNTSLPDKPDYKAIREFKEHINERIVKGEI